ncbi:hypothetical protein D3C72_659010 [compost metagenome]
MLAEPCHAPDSPVDEPRDLVLRVLTVTRIARWCDVSESAVYQWLHRGTDDAPVPSRVVPSIAAGAEAEGLSFDLGVLWPAMRGIPSKQFRRENGELEGVQ